MRFRKVYLEISNICNLTCRFCPGTKRPKKAMTEDELAILLPKLRPYTDYLDFHLMGEPLLHKHLARFLELAEAHGFKVILTTNGTLLAQRGEALLAAGLHKVNISVHSLEDADEAHLEAYLREVAAFAVNASQKGTIVVLRLWNRGHDGGLNDRVLTYLRAHVAGDWAENTRGLRICEKLFVEWGERFEWPDRGAADGGDEVFCYGLGDHFGILCDGTVVPCCLDSDGVIALGNVFSEELSSILDSPRAQAMVKGFACRHATEELCRRCGYARRF